VNVNVIDIKVNEINYGFVFISVCVYYLSSDLCRLPNLQY
jgi:hypothetical protein